MNYQGITKYILITGLVLGLSVTGGASIYAQTGSTQAAQNYYNSNACPFSFSRTMGMYDRGADVRQLQIFLNANSETRLADQGPGSPGLETDFYGTRTKSAVRRFQSLYSQRILTPYNLSYPNGEFGFSTRNVANRICSNGENVPASASMNGGSTGESNDISSLQAKLNSLQIKLDSLQQQQIENLEGRVDELEDSDRDNDDNQSEDGRDRFGPEGEIENFTIIDKSDDNIRASQERSIIGFRFRARHSDITVKRIDLLVEAINQRNERRPWRLLETISVRRGNNRIETEVADVESRWTEVADDVYRYRISIDENVEEDSRSAFRIRFNTLENIDSSSIPQDYRVGFATDTNDPDGVRFVDERGIQYYRGSTDIVNRVRFLDSDSQRSSGGSGGSGSGNGSRGGIYRHIQLF